MPGRNVAGLDFCGPNAKRIPPLQWVGFCTHFTSRGLDNKEVFGHFRKRDVRYGADGPPRSERQMVKFVLCWPTPARS